MTPFQQFTDILAKPTKGLMLEAPVETVEAQDVGVKSSTCFEFSNAPTISQLRTQGVNFRSSLPGCCYFLSSFGLWCNATPIAECYINVS